VHEEGEKEEVVFEQIRSDCISTRFYKFLKGQNLRVPSCLKGIETVEDS